MYVYNYTDECIIEYGAEETKKIRGMCPTSLTGEVEMLLLAILTRMNEKGNVISLGDLIQR